MLKICYFNISHERCIYLYHFLSFAFRFFPSFQIFCSDNMLLEYYMYIRKKHGISCSVLSLALGYVCLKYSHSTANINFILILNLSCCTASTSIWIFHLFILNFVPFTCILKLDLYGKTTYK